MRYSGFVYLLALLAVISGCSRGAQSTTSASASPAPDTPVAAAQSAVPASPGTTTGAAATEAAGAPAAAVPARTPDPNLLGIANGTVLRSYSPVALDAANDANLGNAAESVPVELSATTKAPFTFVFELPGVATISAFGADLADTAQGGTPPTVAFAVSTTSADAGFTDAGTLTGESAKSSKSLPVNVKARWVRVTANGALYRTVSATGTIAPPPAVPNPAGIYIEEARPEKNGTLVMTGTREGDDRAVFVAVGSALTATECRHDRVVATFLGQLQGRTWDAASAGNPDENPSDARAVVNDEATIIAGTDRYGNPIVFMRTSEKPPFCMARVTGTGPHHVLVLDQNPMPEFYPADSATPLPGYRFSAIGAGMLDAGALRDKETVITRGVCKMPNVMSPAQIALLLQWTAAGHKLLLASGGCGNGSDFTWLPYPFSSAGSGPESTHPGLIQVEDNALGTNDRNDAAHFVDVAAFVKNENNRLASANAITTTDPHWCGHFFVAKTSNVNGFAQTYATDGNGILIYDGFSPIDGAYAPLQRLRQLELALHVPADLPCTQHVTNAFVLEPSQEITFVAGKAQSVHAEMQVLANQAWSGHATVSASGDLPATVSPNAFDIAGGTQNLIVAINVPASQKPGVYTVNVIADNGTGKNAQASISLTGTPGAAPLKKQVKAQKRIRIYGIHFDVDSAHIQPRSEPVIADIAQIMRDTAGLRFQVEGHTDSDGGAAYNLGLSQRRAQAVVDSLVARHQIARTRLVAKGYGLAKPVAPNSSAAGKALNRRVELLRLQ